MVKIEVYIFKMIKSFSEKGTSIIGTFQELESWEKDAMKICTAIIT